MIEVKQRTALVAYERSKSNYDIHRSSHIGQSLQLADRITAQQPYGQGDTDYEPRIVDQDPIETDVPLQQIIDRLDFSRFGAVIVVSEMFDVTPYRAPWFGLGDTCTLVDEDPFGMGALVSVHCGKGDALALADAAFCARYRGTKQILGRLVDDRVLSAEEARERLRSHVAGYEAEGRDVRFATGQEPDTESASIAELAATGRRLLDRT